MPLRSGTASPRPVLCRHPFTRALFLQLLGEAQFAKNFYYFIISGAQKQYADSIVEQLFERW